MKRAKKILTSIFALLVLFGGLPVVPPVIDQINTNMAKASLPTTADTTNPNRHYFVAMFKQVVWQSDDGTYAPYEICSDGSGTTCNNPNATLSGLYYDYNFDMDRKIVDVSFVKFDDALYNSDPKWDAIYKTSRYGEQWPARLPSVNQIYGFQMSNKVGVGTTSVSFRMSLTAGSKLKALDPERVGDVRDSIAYYFPVLLIINLEPVETGKINIRHMVRTTSGGTYAQQGTETIEVDNLPKTQAVNNKPFTYGTATGYSLSYSAFSNTPTSGSSASVSLTPAQKTAYVTFFYEKIQAFTGDFDVLPSSIGWKDSFSLKPKNFQMNSCTYISHQYKIERAGMTWTSGNIVGQSTTTSYSGSSYPFVIGAGTHNVYMKIKTTNCGESDWIGPRSLTVSTPTNNNPPTFEVGWTTPGQYNRAGVQTRVVVGTTLDLVHLDDPPPSDPDGDSVQFVGFDFSEYNSWSQSVPSRSQAYMNGFHNIMMDTPGYFCGKGILQDQWGLTATRTACVNVVPPNPVPVITGSTDVVEGRPLAEPLSAANSYSPMAGRTIDHSRDIWTNKKTTYTTVGNEIVTLEVYDNTGMKSVSPATHTITVRPDLPPVPQLDFVPITIRGNQVTFTNTSHSPDNDTLVVNTVSYIYDANNDGNFAETSTSVTMDANKRFIITPAKVGKYQFTVTVKEDWGKQASGKFILEVVNDSPTATFNVKGEVTEPTITPFTYATPATMMSSTWKNTTMLDDNAGKRWARDSGENSLVATTDREKFAGITTNIISTEKFENYFDWTCPSSNCAGNYIKGKHSGYLGGGYAAGYNEYQERTDIWSIANPSTQVKMLYNVELSLIDRATGLAYGIRTDRSVWPSKYYWVIMRIADLINPALPTVPYITDQLGTGNNPYYNFLMPVQLMAENKYLTTFLNLSDFGTDSKALDQTDSKLTSYPWGNNALTPGAKTTTISGYSAFPLHASWKDQAKNVYVLATLTNPMSEHYYDLVKLNSSTGNIDWKISEKRYDYTTFKIFGDGKYVIEDQRHYDYNTGGKVIVRDVATGTMIRELVVTGPGYSYKGVLGIYNGIVLVSSNGNLYAYDYINNFNLLWTVTGFFPQDVYGSYNATNDTYGDLISKDGYLLFFTRLNINYNSRQHKLNILNIANGAIQTLDLGLPLFDDNDNFQVTRLDYVGDGEIDIYYEYEIFYSDGSRYGKYFYLMHLKTQPASNPLTTNEVYAPGQLVSPASLNTADGEFTFDLKFNRDPDASKPAGFGFRIKDHKNLYRVEVFKSRIDLVKYVNGARTVIKTASYPIGNVSYLTYKVRVVGSAIKVYASGTPVIDATDTQFPAAGGFGLYSAASKAEFKNFGYKLLSGGTSLTFDNVVLVSEPANYSTTYEDLENDPKINALTEWRFVHDKPNMFLNAGDGKSGLSALNNQTVQSPYLNFDKVGLYLVTYKVKDDPNPSYLYPNMAFDSYRKSSEPYSAYVVVHRKPIARYTLSINSTNKNVVWNDTSYDPDRWLSASNYSTEATGINYQTTRGILERKYYFISPSGVTKNEKLITPTETGTYTVGLAVKDEYGAWSTWNEQEITIATTTTPNTPPVPGFTTSYFNTYRGVGITINSTASDAEDGGRENLKHEYYIRNLTTGGAEGLHSTVRTSWVKTFNSLGTFSIRQVVEDASGATAQIERQITIHNRLPTANITMPSSLDQNSPTKLAILQPTFNWTYNDQDGDTQSQFQLRVYRINGALVLDSGTRNGTAAAFTATADLPEKVNLYVQVRVHDGYDWGNWSANKYFYIETNRPPAGDFTWTPELIYEGDTVRLSSAVSDPDEDQLSVEYEVTPPTGAKQRTNYVWNYPYPNEGPLVQADRVGTWTVKMTVSDAKSAPVISTRTFQVNALTIQGYVKHTPEWESNRLAYNASNSPARPSTTFWAGEAFVLQADTTDTGQAATKASEVIVRMFGDNTKALAPQNSGKTRWTTLLVSADTDIRFEALENGSYTFLFTVVYSNGTVKTSAVTIDIEDTTRGYVKVHRIR